ncbi:MULTISPECIES: hypothetical protein [unclassified Lentimonas]|uniref:hypothetical protein n=1 Tax=unclassified Lentimonas TaxID=2630993 RepID=UPI0013226687|nr:MULTISPECIES: hypothetical protein [unclassified Lentimonas]CAA6678062.1 Unannotated [Lentimonas sp. CC4]CAA6687453.1 Unannotated [Lentimonas sp. CC6]CAA7076347.1 Unannotated [Lentimonas sp. CC4]CAA7171995.1 Unannotated [Lentimonas sp. CC21]CAA7180679.1 Unannotated [Lentimonas sp. CC8]
MKVTILVLAFIGLGLHASPSGIFELKKKDLSDSGFSFKVGRVVQENDRNPELVYIFATFPTSINWGERTYTLSEVEIEDQAFRHETSIQLNKNASSDETAMVRFRIRRDAIDDTLISGVYGNGSFYYQADLGVILGDELDPQDEAERGRKRYRDELIRVMPGSTEAIRRIEYLKRNRLERLLLSHRKVHDGIELIVEGSGLKVEVDPSLDNLKLNLSLKGLDRYRCLNFALQNIDARSIVDGNIIKIEPQPVGGDQ